jgi:hypothetical protein
MAYARQLTGWFYAGLVDSLWARAAQALKDRMQQPQGFKDIMGQVVGNVGAEVDVISERYVRSGGRLQYWRVSRHAQEAGALLLRWVFNDAWEISGLGLGGAEDAPPIDKPPN